MSQAGAYRARNRPVTTSPARGDTRLVAASERGGLGHPVGLGRHSVGNVNPGAASMLAPLARTGPGLWTDARFAGRIRLAAGLEQFYNDLRKLV